MHMNETARYSKKYFKPNLYCNQHDDYCVTPLTKLWYVGYIQLVPNKHNGIIIDITDQYYSSSNFVYEIPGNT